MRALVVSALLVAFPGLADASQRVRASGGFDPDGRLVAFADKFGWESYEAELRFSLEDDGRTLTRDSRLDLTVRRRDGKHRAMSCRAKTGELTARLVVVPGRTALLAECVLRAEDFARAVDLHHEDVGAPVFVFEAVLEGGRARAGGQRGLYFRPDTPVLASALTAYASNESSSGLAVLFGAP